MRSLKSIRFLFFILISTSTFGAATAQSEASVLKPGASVERGIARGQTHSFGVKLEQNELLKLVVEQHGIDLIVRLFSPTGKSLGEFDSPNGTDGPENVSFIAKASGIYRINVLPLQEESNTTAGRYEIKIKDLRAATKEELDAIKYQDAIKVKGNALLVEVADNLELIRLPETRARLGTQVAQLLWDSDEKRARKLMAEAIEGVKEYLAGIDQSDQTYYQTYQMAMQLRGEVFTALATRDPELALDFLTSTRILTDPNVGQGGERPDQERQLELSLASQMAAKNPKRALQIAEESLKKGYAYNLIDTLMRLRTADLDSATKLAGEIAERLKGESLLKNFEATNLLVNLLRMSGSARTGARTLGSSGEEQMPSLLPEEEYKELFNRALSAAIAFTPPPTNFYSNERNSAQTIIHSLKSMTAEMQKYAPEKAALLDKKETEFNTPPDPQNRLWQKYQDTINNGTLDAALEAVGRAPQEMRDQLYQQVAQKALNGGDVARAKQILTENIRNPMQRQQALRNLDQQAFYVSLNNGKLEDALRNAANLSSTKERAGMLIQIVNRFGPSQKKADMIDILEQARALIGATGRAEDQEQMNTLLQLSQSYAQFDSKRSFEIMEPLVDQLNEMSEAAALLNGFGQQYLRNGELLLQNGNSVGSAASQLIQTLGSLAATDFDRARSVADRIQRPEVRLVAYLTIAQNAITQRINGGANVFAYIRGG
ncbi:MAG TPA: hypothetical protein VF766_16165 [Pyrinomonadaceae bacterium]